MQVETEIKTEYDYVVVGSGFGGSVAALRLSEKGYSVLVIEKGKWYSAGDFPKSNWNLKRWLWIPALRFFGIMKISLFRHISILSGTGVGGGSLVYANTLPQPKKEFYSHGSWKGLADWEKELRPFYRTALKMLGAVKNPQLFDSDKSLKILAENLGKTKEFSATRVSVYFGKDNSPDPYFRGKGPIRSGCTFCGGCMTGCRYNAKNTLDKNYLHLARRLGAGILAEHEVTHVEFDKASSEYTVVCRKVTRVIPVKLVIKSRGIVFAGGVLGTLHLLLKLRKKSLTALSGMLGQDIRTNNESLVFVPSGEDSRDFSKGLAIGSILHTDRDSHLETVRYASGSGFWRLSVLPLVNGNIFNRIKKIIFLLFSPPFGYLRLLFVQDWAKRTPILLFMQHLDSRLRFRMGIFGFMQSEIFSGKAPTAFIPSAQDLSGKFSKVVKGKPFVFFLESLFGIPSTAHILGGAVMGKSAKEGVINKYNQVFGYKNMYICDGSMISANPGVNPSLTITALSERAMSFIAKKK